MVQVGRSAQGGATIIAMLESNPYHGTANFPFDAAECQRALTLLQATSRPFLKTDEQRYASQRILAWERSAVSAEEKSFVERAKAALQKVGLWSGPVASPTPPPKEKTPARSFATSSGGTLKWTNTRANKKRRSNVPSLAMSKHPLFLMSNRVWKKLQADAVTVDQVTTDPQAVATQTGLSVETIKAFADYGLLPDQIEPLTTHGSLSNYASTLGIPDDYIRSFDTMMPFLVSKTHCMIEGAPFFKKDWAFFFEGQPDDWSDLDRGALIAESVLFGEMGNDESGSIMTTYRTDLNQIRLSRLARPSNALNDLKTITEVTGTQLSFNEGFAPIIWAVVAEPELGFGDLNKNGKNDYYFLISKATGTGPQGLKGVKPNSGDDLFFYTWDGGADRF